MITEELTAKEVAEHLLKLKLEVYKKFKTHSELIDAMEARADATEASTLMIREDIKRGEQQRISFNSSIKRDIEGLRVWMESSDSKHTEVIVAIKELTETLNKTVKDTDANSIILQRQIEQQKIDNAVQDALYKEKEPYREYKKKAIGTIVAMVAVGTVLFIWDLILKGQQ